MRRPWVLVLLLASCLPPAAAAPIDLCAHAERVDVLHHDVVITVGPEARLSGRGALRMRTPATTIALDTKELTVTSVRARGHDLPFRQEADRVCILSDGEETHELTWHTNPGARTVHFAPDQVWAGYTTSAWMPTSQRPEVRATLSLTIVAPDTWKVTASGARVSPGRFALDRPSPPFLFAFAAGIFEEATLDIQLEMRSPKDTPYLRLHALGPSRPDLENVLATTAPMFRYFDSHLRSRYPALDYTQVFVHGDAAQEAAMMALLDDTSLADLRKDPQDDWLFSHELAHEWFGWTTSCADFSDFWLNEGFATFFVGAYKEERWGRPAYDNERALWNKRSQKVHDDHRDAPLALRAPGTPESKLQPRGVTYSRGALVLAKLREELGDDVFWDMLQRYVRDSRSVRTKDLEAAATAAAGRDLAPFFEQWVYAPALP